MQQSLEALTGVTAHEFFHLWNVKRIRPQTLEPVDYTKENYTRALWFSEGVTSTAEGTIQLRAGLIDEKQYLQRLGDRSPNSNAAPRTSRSPQKTRAWTRGWKATVIIIVPTAAFLTTTRANC